MENNVTKLPRADSPRPVVALVAHDRRKDEMVEWATYNRGTLSRCTIFATRTTGLTLQSALDAPIQLMLSGPMGGDAQIAAMVAEGRIRAVIFFVDPLSAHPHDPDIQTVMRVCNVHSIAIATNVAGADLFLASPLLHTMQVAHAV